MPKVSRRESRRVRRYLQYEPEGVPGVVKFLVLPIAGLFVALMAWEKFGYFEYVGNAYSISTDVQAIHVSATIVGSGRDSEFTIPFSQRDINRLTMYRTETTMPTYLPGHRTGNLNPPPVIRFSARPPYPWAASGAYHVRSFEVLK